jgi:hypothetical protein
MGPGLMLVLWSVNQQYHRISEKSKISVDMHQSSFAKDYNKCVYSQSDQRDGPVQGCTKGIGVICISISRLIQIFLYLVNPSITVQ